MDQELQLSDFCLFKVLPLKQKTAQIEDNLHATMLIELGSTGLIAKLDPFTNKFICTYLVQWVRPNQFSIIVFDLVE